ncbi:hypothetical protein [Palleronia abyssalis]|uniref:Uncharacterized protein n=1 Tax=Palleronia abyssalis TaxID=1501240 RepID=A0A2R8BU92_9RHOB|nr:hypothetical protein [Palleronia abyssalis]SPJ23710.1 hypothetical protein PAA8504_01525 [Palleronia abyssalis]
MPLDRFVLILVLVILAAGITVWLGTIVFAGISQPWILSLLIPAALIAYVVVRVIRDRMAEGDKYDRTPR